MPTIDEDLCTLESQLTSQQDGTGIGESLEALARIHAALADRDKMLRFAPVCLSCGKKCEPERWCYFTPTCYACLPPPAPLEVIPSQAERLRQSGKP